MNLKKRTNNIKNPWRKTHNCVSCVAISRLSKWKKRTVNILPRKSLEVFWTFFFVCRLFAVKKRIDRTQSRLDKLSNQELLLDAAHALRIERERQKELQTQLEHQMQDIQRANTVNSRKNNFFSLFASPMMFFFRWVCRVCNYLKMFVKVHTRLQNELKNARMNSVELSPEQIMNSILEKTQVNY